MTKSFLTDRQQKQHRNMDLFTGVFFIVLLHFNDERHQLQVLRPQLHEPSFHAFL